MALINCPHEYHKEIPNSNLLQASAYNFYLGGSRRMHLLHAKNKEHQVFINSKTDYDLYVTYSEEVACFLSSLGYKALSGEYDDPDTEVVSIVSKGNTQIILRRDAVFYRLVFEYIPVKYYIDYLWKSGPNKPSRKQITETFNALFAVARAIFRGV